MYNYLEDYIDFVPILIKLGAEVNIHNYNKYTPLMLSCIDLKIEQFNMLIEHGADINYNSGRCSLLRSVHDYIPYTGKDKFNSTIEMLLSTNIDLTAKVESRCASLFSYIFPADINFYRHDTGFEFICQKCDEDLVKLCFDTHEYYTEEILLKCIKLGKHKDLLISYLEQLFYKKIDF